LRSPPRSTPFPYTTLFRSLEQLREVGPVAQVAVAVRLVVGVAPQPGRLVPGAGHVECVEVDPAGHRTAPCDRPPTSARWARTARSEEHTSELQSLAYLVCR